MDFCGLVFSPEYSMVACIVLIYEDRGDGGEFAHYRGICLKLYLERLREFVD